jgi:hypothetical protein
MRGGVRGEVEGVCVDVYQVLAGRRNTKRGKGEEKVGLGGLGGV